MQVGGRSSHQGEGRSGGDWAGTAPLFCDVTEVVVVPAACEPSPKVTVTPPSEKGATRKGKGFALVTLATYPERTVLDEAALAEALNVSKRTLRRMVARFEVPPAVAFAGRSTWQVGKVLAWFEARAERAARDAERASRRFDGMK